VPSSVPDSVIASIASSSVFTVPASSFSVIAVTISVPSTWSSPVVVSAEWAINNVPTSSIATISQVSSLVVVATVAWVPPYISTVYVPSSNIVTVPASTWTTAIPSWLTTVTVTASPVSITLPAVSTVLAPSIPTGTVTIYIETTTVYVISSNNVFTTSGTVTVLPTVYDYALTSVPSFVPASVSIPSSYVVVPVSALHCSAFLE